MPLRLTDFTEPSLASARAVSSAELIVEELACRRGERVVFTGLSFRLPPGGALVLTGANGSGKSSLLRLVAGLLTPAAGRLLWGAKSIADDIASHHARLHYVGHLDALKPAMTPRESLAFWAALRGSRRSGAEHAIDRCAFRLSTSKRSQIGRAVGSRPVSGAASPSRACWPRPRNYGCSTSRRPPSIRDSQARLEQAIAAHRAADGMVMIATHAPIALDTAATLALDGYAPRLDELDAVFAE